MQDKKNTLHNPNRSFEKIKNIFKFTLSSFLGFITDYAAFTAFSYMTTGIDESISIPLVNISARVISSIVNFTVNKKFVFKNKDSVLKTGAQYFTLAACILAGNTLFLSILVNRFSINKYAGKLITEFIFFFISWSFQRYIIFRSRKRLN